MKTNNQIEKSMQILLWIWFGIITSFTSVNVANIVKLETKVKSLELNYEHLNNRIILLKYQSLNEIKK